MKWLKALAHSSFPKQMPAWALQYPSQSVSLTPTNITDQTFTLTRTNYDFLLVYIVNSVYATAPVN
ncbi:MAG: hypothetical protein ACLQU1_12810 [Bryobacteraceae bacterium]